MALNVTSVVGKTSAAQASVMRGPLTHGLLGGGQLTHVPQWSPDELNAVAASMAGLIGPLNTHISDSPIPATIIGGINGDAANASLKSIRADTREVIDHITQSVGLLRTHRRHSAAPSVTRSPSSTPSKRSKLNATLPPTRSLAPACTSSKRHAKPTSPSYSSSWTLSTVCSRTFSSTYGIVPSSNHSAAYSPTPGSPTFSYPRPCPTRTPNATTHNPGSTDAPLKTLTVSSENASTPGFPPPTTTKKSSILREY